MKVLFINPIVRIKDDPRHIPHGLAVLAAVLRKAGYDIEILDINANRYTAEQVKDKLSNLDFDVVGIGCIVSVYRELKWIAEYLKTIRPEVPIIVGGSVGSSIPELVLEKTKVDVVCIGEGEETLQEYLQCLSTGRDYSDVKGLAFKRGGKICFTPSRPLIKDLDSLPIPAYDLLPIEIYVNNCAVGFGRELDFVSSRGCPYDCVFCYQPFGQTFRSHSADYVLNVIEYLKKSYDIDFLYFADDEFMGSNKRVYEFARKKMDNPITRDVRWSCCGRVNLVNLELYKLIKSAGCTFVGYGFESGSDFILKKIHKRITSAQQKEAVRVTKESGLRFGCSFMLGFPWETYDTARATVDLCIDAQIPLSALLFATPYPKTQLFEYCWNKGILNDSNFEDFILGMGDVVDLQLNITENFSDKQLLDLRDNMIAEVKANVPKPKPEFLRGQLIDLYGEKNYQLFRKKYTTDPKLREHYKNHGFNDFFIEEGA